MQAKPFWEETYRDQTVSTFSKGPTVDVEEFYKLFPTGGRVLDMGCGEGRNSIFMAKPGCQVDALDLSENGIGKAKAIAAAEGVQVNFFLILSHRVLHLPERDVRSRFIRKMQEHTAVGGYHAVGIFTNRLPATPDNAPYTHSLFDVGELPALYAG